jgi:hypothetical protein
MTAVLLASHQEKQACKPNKVYTLKITTKPSPRKKASSTKCQACDGKGWLTLGKVKGGARIGAVTRPCPQNCVPPKDEYEAFIRGAWAQVGTG